MVLAFFVACSPAKKAARQDDALNILKAKFEVDAQAQASKAVADWISKNPCIFPEINLDSLCALVNSPGSPVEAQQYVINGIDTVRLPAPLPRRILVPTRDLRAEQLLRDSLAVLSTRLAECKARAAGRKDAITEEKPDRWKIDNWFFVALAEFIIILTFIIFKIKK